MIRQHCLALAVAALLCISPLAAQVNHRHSQSPVRNQGGRGTCAAFSICSTLETFPGIPTDLSEQLLYATVKLHQHAVDVFLEQQQEPLTISEGDVFEAYVPLFALVGTCHEQFLPYNPNPLRVVGDNVPESLRLFVELSHATPADLRKIRDLAGKYGFSQDACEIRPQQQMQDVDRLKRLLEGGMRAIPVGYRIHGPNWSDIELHANTSDGTLRDIIHPGMMEEFARVGGPWMTYNQARAECMRTGEKLLEELNNGNWVRREFVNLVPPEQLQPGNTEIPSNPYGGHAVVLVGYDEHGFIAKNSWGEDWGDGGYCRINFDYHQLYVRTGLLLREASIRPPMLSPFENHELLRNAQFHLKVQQRGSVDHPSVQFSTWQMSMRDADVELVEYIIELQTPSGAWWDAQRRTVSTGEPTQRRGAPLEFSGHDLATLQKAPAVRIRATFGYRDVNDPLRIDRNRAHATARYGPIDLRASVAKDYMPLDR